MVTPSLKQHFQQMGVALIPLAAGAHCFVEEMTGLGADTTIVVGGAMKGGKFGEGALGAAQTPQATVEVRVDQHSHPHLADHSIAGTPVLPMVLAVEWFLRAARACRPDLVPTAVSEVKVLRGIKLENYRAGGDHFVVTARQQGTGADATLSVELRGAKQVLHYSATVTLSEKVATAPAGQTTPALDPWTQPAIYDGHVLFHGPSFQVIESVQGVSREGVVGTLSGTLAGTQKSTWPAEAWHSDAAAMDGGLQLALLWSQHVLKGAVLPMAIGGYRSYAHDLSTGPLQAVVHARKVLDARTVCDIRFSDANGRLVAELLGVETVLRPAQTKAPAALA